MLHLVEGVQPGLFEEHVGPLKSRLRQMLSEGAKSAKQIESKFKLIHFAPRRVESRHFQVIAGALLEGKRLNLRYWNRDRQEESQRVISPQKLVHYRENWSLDAWCHKAKGLRIFSLEAVLSVQVLDEAAIDVPAEKMDKHFRSGYGIFAGETTERARLKFSAQRAQWVSKETWHHDQESHFEEDGSYILEVPYSSDRELLMDLLRHSPEVEVLTSLRAATEKNLASKGRSVAA
jgi:predicted DNA-binding transcriptional regulator YafY